ncbi:MAG: signal peptidase II [Bacteroidales bacterium]|nr:signal peptidase II [Bacteroidales bacterium]
MSKAKHKGLTGAFIIIAVILIIDQVLKIWVKTHMAIGQEIPVFGNWFKLLFIENPGMAFGWMGGGGIMKTILSIFRIVAVIALFIIMFRISRKNTRFGVLLGLALITAGAMGNIIDCVFYGEVFHYAGWLHGKVVDMLYFPIIDIAREDNSWLPNFLFGQDGHFIFFRPIFNFADASITVGVFYMILFQWKWLKSL